MRRVIDSEGHTIAVPLPEPGLARCAAVLGHTRRGDPILCRVLVQRTTNGDLVDGVRAHYKLCHPERKL